MRWHKTVTEIADTEIKAKIIIKNKREKGRYNTLRILREIRVTLGFFLIVHGVKMQALLAKKQRVMPKCGGLEGT